MADIQCVFESMTGKGSIYISNFIAAQNLQILQKKGIKAILSVARSGLVHHSKGDIPYYLYIPAEDHEEYQLYKYFNQTFEFIEQARKETNILVHCMVGVSRSVTIVIAYLLKKYKCSLGQVIMMLQRKRSKINPNKGFIEQLKKYAIQEGLQCDFDGVEVPTIKERSLSKNRRNLSISKQSTNTTMYLLTNPLSKYQSKKTSKETLFQKTAATKQDISQYMKKSEQLKNLNEKQNIKNAEDVDTVTKEMSNQVYKSDLDSPPLLRKGLSIDSKDSFRPSMRMTIEERISLVRSKLLKKQSTKRESIDSKQQSKTNNGCDLHSQFTAKKNSNKNFEQYFNSYSKKNPITLNITQLDEKNKTIKKDEDMLSPQFSIYSPHKNESFFQKDYKTSEKPVHGRLIYHKKAANIQI